MPLLRRNPALTIGSANPTGFMAYLRFNHLHPPFNNVAIRRAVLMAVDQTDYMAAITGGDAAAFRTCKAMLACGTSYGREIGATAMPGDLDKARAALKVSGYNGEKAVILNPTDLPTVGPLGDVTYDLLKKIGMNVEMAASDFGTVQHRRVSKEPVEKGGWSIFHFHAPSATSDTPTGAGAVTWPGSHWLLWLVFRRCDRAVRAGLAYRRDSELSAMWRPMPSRRGHLRTCPPFRSASFRFAPPIARIWPD